LLSDQSGSVLGDSTVFSWAGCHTYAHFPQPQQSVAIIGGYAARNMQNITTIQTNAAQLGEGNANIAYELGRLHITPPPQFIGGAVQSYYEQGYNNQYYQYQPPTED
jgi:hypothetical protein